MGNGNGHYGYAGLAMDRETMGAEIPVYSTLYDFYQDEGFDHQLGPEYYVATDWWPFYYELIKKCNLTLGAVPITEFTSAEELAYVGNALGYVHLLITTWLAPTNIRRLALHSLTAKPKQNKIYGLTVPIRTEFTTQQELQKTPEHPSTPCIALS